MKFRMACKARGRARARGNSVRGAGFRADDTIRSLCRSALGRRREHRAKSGSKTFQFLATTSNAKGGALGRNSRSSAYDNKLNAPGNARPGAEGIDSGIRIITQGNGLAFAAAISTRHQVQ